jgi:short-subunit dehydrogenase
MVEEQRYKGSRQMSSQRMQGLTILSIVSLLATIWKVMQHKPADLYGKSVLITGSSRGLGLALAEAFALQGARLIICARQESELEQARQHLAAQGADVLAIPCDVTQREQVQELVSRAIQQYGAIDVLVNNAGLITVGPLTAQTLADYEESMSTMFWGPVYAALAVLPHMRERKTGWIVNISSIGGKISVPHLLPYSCAKFALTGFSEGLCAELAQEGVTVVTVNPGLMRTGSPLNAFFKGEHHAEYTWFSIADSLPLLSISARRVAQQIVQAVRTGRTVVTPGWSARLLIILHSLFPGVVTRLLAIVNRLLPGPGKAEGLDRSTGRASQTSLTRSFLTRPGQRAAKAYNENTAPE